VDYPLAAEHPLPAAPDDALTAVAWAADHAKAESGDTGRLAIGGDSAGANLVAANQHLHPRGDLLDDQAFEISDLFGSGEDVAVFGSFAYRSVSLGQAVRSPFCIHAKVKDGKIAFFQFMEDTFATARSFRSNGAWTIQTQPDVPTFEV
jgi:hypothetical protein